ncbi:MAG: transporter [Hyphomicrobiales bacterium]|nr:transporter [Hyphomicrobiales bacterium]
MVRSGLVGAALVAAALQPCLADDAAAPAQTADKSAYTLFNPTPKALLREFSPHRPGKANSATTLDAGQIELESDFVNITNDPLNSVHPGTRAMTIGAPILYVGLTNFMELDIGTNLFNFQSQFDGTSTTKAHGFGDSSVALGINLFGNEGGPALGLVPSVKIPTAKDPLGNGYAEYALAVPFAFNIPGNGQAEVEADYGYIRNDANNGYTSSYGFVANVSYRTPVKHLGVGIELAGSVPMDTRQFSLSLDPFVTYLVAKNLQIDAGAYLGLNKYTPRAIFYTGFARRF